MMGAADTPLPTALPSFDYWITEAIRLLEAEIPDYAGAAFCAGKATAAARSDIEWARAEDINGIAQFNLGNINQAITSFTAIRERLSAFVDADHRYWQARALFNKGATLGALGRSEDEIAVYDDLLARFGTATELPLRERVANTLINKGLTLGGLGRSEDAIAVYDAIKDSLRKS
jgi:tetratricopeptide (TPR) repeat protein